MLSKNHTKFIQSLHLKKNRETEGIFIAEGKKTVSEILASDWEIIEILASESFLNGHASHIGDRNIKTTAISSEELKKISALSQPDDAFLLCKIPAQNPDHKKLKGDLVLYLDGIRDPGNLGTIIRVCDWFGVQSVFCSRDCTELYNSKTIQASMGSFLRVNVFYEELEDVLRNCSSVGIELPVYGAFTEGENVFGLKEWEPGILIIGNEANGISEKNKELISKTVSIPSFSKKAPESLNAAIATSILVAEYRRKKLA
ncbi:MAG: RNA methyltransferase [Bacteroidia bacterium]|nr:RNA methyltransferase [Bacteroidia bacterium]